MSSEWFMPAPPPGCNCRGGPPPPFPLPNQGFQPCHQNLPAVPERDVPDCIPPRIGNPEQPKLDVKHLKTQIKKFTSRNQDLEKENIVHQSSEEPFIRLCKIEYGI